MRMSHRIWLFVAGLSGALAVLAGAAIKHKVPPFEPAVQLSLDKGQLYHILHSLALLGIATLLMATEGRRSTAGTWLINLAGIAFAGGVTFFSFGIYTAYFDGAAPSVKTVPVGGMLFAAGWFFLALSAFGLKSGR
jgi:uncharacterized membrane protein YgdD (TMEM256/DUF423 family)